MKNNSKNLLKCLAISFLLLLLINFSAFLVDFISLDRSQSWSVGYDNLTFLVNGETSGLEWGAATTNILLAVVFIALVARDVRDGKIVLRASRS